MCDTCKDFTICFILIWPLTCIAIWREIIAFKAAEAIYEDLNVWLESLYPREFDGCGTTKGATDGRRSSHFGVILPTMMVENWKIKNHNRSVIIYIYQLLELLPPPPPPPTSLHFLPCWQTSFAFSCCFESILSQQIGQSAPTGIKTNYACILHRSNICSANSCENTCVVQSYVYHIKIN